MKKIISLLLCIITLATMCFGLAACNQTTEEEGTIVEMEDDSYDMSSEGESIGSKIINTALSGIGSGISGGVSKVVSNLGTWAVEGIIKSLGFSYYSEAAFQKEVVDSLNQIKSEIINLEGKIDWLTEGFQDSQYLQQYSKFKETYQSISKEISVIYKSLLDIEDNIKANEVEYLQQNLEDLCAEIKGNGATRSDLDVELTKFGNYFMGSETTVDQLQQYSIFKIADHFVCTQTPYAENIYDKMQEIVSEPYSAYYVGYSLVILQYTYAINQYGVKNIWLDGDGNLIGYQMLDQAENEAYLNCTSNKLEEFKKTYATQISGTVLENGTAKSILNATYNGQSVGGKLSLIIGYMSQITEQYNTNTKLYTDFVNKYKVNKEEGKLTLTALGQKASVNVSTVWARDILSVDSLSSDGTIKINYDAFGNIHKADFEKFASTILPYSYTKNIDGTQKKLTFREFFEREGFNFPTNKSTKYLILGAEKGLPDRDQYVNNGYKYKKSIAIVCVNLDTVIEDFVNNKNYERIYYALYCSKISVPSNCGPKFREEWRLVEGTKNSSGYLGSLTLSTIDLSTWKNHMFSSPVQYFTIKGLSWNPAKGVQSVGNTF